MEIIAYFFTAFMITAATAATILIGMFAGGVWGALGFAAFLVLIYRATTYSCGPDPSQERDQLNALQCPLADKQDEGT